MKKQVELEIQYGDTLIITVQDTGKGIQEEEIGALFTKGYSTKEITVVMVCIL